MSALAGLVEKGLVAPDWAEALAPVDDRIAAMGRFLREEVAAGRGYQPAGDLVFRAFRPFALGVTVVAGSLRAELHDDGEGFFSGLLPLRDVPEAYRLLMEHGERGAVYNVGRGSAVRMADVLDLLCRMCSIKVEVVPRAERMRPGDVGAIIADSARLSALTGWRPRHTLEQSLHDTLDYWRTEGGTPP